MEITNEQTGCFDGVHPWKSIGSQVLHPHSFTWSARLPFQGWERWLCACLRLHPPSVILTSKMHSPTCFSFESFLYPFQRFLDALILGLIPLWSSPIYFSNFNSFALVSRKGNDNYILKIELWNFLYFRYLNKILEWVFIFIILLIMRTLFS